MNILNFLVKTQKGKKKIHFVFQSMKFLFQHLFGQHGTDISGYRLFLVRMLSHLGMFLLPGVGNGWQ